MTVRPGALSDRATTVPIMTEHLATRPTDTWRRWVADEAAAQAAGSTDRAYAAELFPESLLTRTDEVLAAFEAELLASPAKRTDGQVFAAIERVVLALNAVNDEYHGAAYETDERERLCQYIDDALAAVGVDVPGLAARRGIGPGELTDDWRDW